ncbi:MAG: DUF6279 family lipoprotein, partial [Steroidobacteraceae bacterium]
RIDVARVEVEGLWRDVVRRASPQAARRLADLSDAQIDELLRNLAQDDEELREKYCDPDAATLARRRERTIVSAIEDWTGRLSRDQRALLAERTPEAAFGETLARFLLSPEERWTETYRRRFLANRERVVTLLAEIDAALSPKQRARLAARFHDLARDLRGLAARGPDNARELSDISPRRNETFTFL